MLKRYDESEPTSNPPFALLPAIDIRAGRVVRLLRGDFEAETVYGSDPAQVASGFAAAGAAYLHVVDLDGAREGRAVNRAAVARIVERVGERLAVEVAGGLRREEAAAEAIDAGARRIVLGTAALRAAGLARRLVDRFGSARIVVALDVRDGMAVGGGWLPGEHGVPVERALAGLADAGVVTFEVTAIDRDGTFAGPDLALLERLVGLGGGYEIVASAGIASTDDIRHVREIGCRGAIVGRALYEGRLSLEDALAASR